MGTILKFAASQSPEQVKSTYSGGIKTGEIILFPGVRYDRTTKTPTHDHDIKQSSDIARDVLIL